VVFQQNIDFGIKQSLSTISFLMLIHIWELILMAVNRIQQSVVTLVLELMLKCSGVIHCGRYRQSVVT
jgi:uncharacterized membrane protein